MHAVAGLRPHAEQHDGEDAVVPPARMPRLGRREESLAEVGRRSCEACK
jgi:hypothetical protein